MRLFYLAKKSVADGYPAGASPDEWKERNYDRKIAGRRDHADTRNTWRGKSVSDDG